MKKYYLYGLSAFIFLAVNLTFTEIANAQIIAIEGQHDLSGFASHRDFNPPQSTWTNSFDQILPIATLGPSSHLFLLDDNIFDSSIAMHSQLDTTTNSVTGSVIKDGHVNYAGWIGNNALPNTNSNAIIDFSVDLDATNVPFRFTVDWDLLPYIATGDGWGYSSFIIYAGDRIGLVHYGFISGGSMDNISPNLGPTGTFVFEGVSRHPHLKFTIQLHGPGDGSGFPGCDEAFCGFGTISQHSVVSYELLVGDAAVSPDTDGDGVNDNLDNCTLIANADQYDSNGDGFGNPCDPDLDNNGTVNFADYAALTIAFLATPVTPHWNADADLNNDGVINFGDIAMFSPYFLMPPGPSSTGL